MRSRIANSKTIQKVFLIQTSGHKRQPSIELTWRAICFGDQQPREVSSDIAAMCGQVVNLHFLCIHKLQTEKTVHMDLPQIHFFVDPQKMHLRQIQVDILSICIFCASTKNASEANPCGQFFQFASFGCTKNASGTGPTYFTAYPSGSTHKALAQTVDPQWAATQLSTFRRIAACPCRSTHRHGSNCRSRMGGYTAFRRIAVFPCRSLPSSASDCTGPAVGHERNQRRSRSCSPEELCWLDHSASLEMRQAWHSADRRPNT